MHRERTFRFRTGLAVVAVFVLAAGRTHAQKPDDVLIETQTQPRIETLWIGVECTPLDPAMRAQLKLEAPQGMLVRTVVPGSPAAKAGIEPFDVLLKVGDRPLTNVATLTEAVVQSPDKDLAIELLRAGEPKKVSVRPEPRPEQYITHLPGPPGVVVGPNAEQIQSWIDNVRKGQAMAGPMQFDVIREAWVVGREAELPADMTVTITKTGGKPAGVTVKQGDQTWEAREDKLDELPAEVRAHVESLLFRGPRRLKNLDLEAQARQVQHAVESADRTAREALEKLQADVQKLREQVQKLEAKTR